MDRLRAWNNYVIVHLQEAHDTLLTNGLLIPRMNQGTHCHGTVQSIGPDVREQISIGDVALVPPYGIGIAFDFQRQSYLALLDYEILGHWPQEATAHDDCSSTSRSHSDDSHGTAPPEPDRSGDQIRHDHVPIA